MMVREDGRCSGRVAFPIVSVGIHYDALHRRGGIVAFEASSIAAVILGNNYAAPVGVEENLGGIKPHPARGIEWPVDPISVKLPRLHTRHEYVPIMVGAVDHGIELQSRARVAHHFPGQRGATPRL